MKRLLAGLGLLAALAVATVIVSTLVLTVYPGAFSLTAPVLCPDGQPDPFVVRYDETASDGGRTTTFTLFCMGDRGEFTEVGTMKPLGLVTAAVAVGIVVTTVALVLLAPVRRNRRRRQRRAERERAAAAAAPGPLSSPPPEDQAIIT